MIVDISTLLKNINIDINMVIFENINIDVDKAILKNIDIDKAIQNMHVLSNGKSPCSEEVMRMNTQH